MEEATVLAKMRSFFEANDCPPEVLDRLAETKATDVLRESIEALEFLMYLEGELGGTMNANSIGPAMANKTFGELAAEVCRQMDK